jgi:hypothetical protein
MGESSAGGEVSGFYNLLPIFLGTGEEVLVIGEGSGVFSEWTRLNGKKIKRMIRGGMSVHVVGSVDDLEFLVGADAQGMGVVSGQWKVLVSAAFMIWVNRVTGGNGGSFRR